MARRDAVEVAFVAKFDAFKKELNGIPGLTATQTKKMSNEWLKAHRASEKAAAAAARKSSKAWGAAANNVKGYLTATVPGFGAATTAANAMGISFKGAAASAAPLLAAFAGVAVIAAAAVVFWKVGSAAEKTRKQINDLSQTTALVPETLSALEVAGVDLAKMGPALGDFNKHILDTANKTGRAQKTFAALGVDVFDAEKRLKSANTVFLESVSALQQIESPAERAGHFTKLWGSAGRELMATLGDTAMEDWTRLAARYGVEAASNTEETVAWGAATSTFQTVLRSTVDRVIGSFGIRGGMAGALQNFTIGFQASVTFMSTLFGEFTKDLQAGWHAITTLDASAFKAAISDLVNPLENVRAATAAATEAARDAFLLAEARTAAAGATTKTGSTAFTAAPKTSAAKSSSTGAASDAGSKSFGAGAELGVVSALISATEVLTEKNLAFQQIQADAFAQELEGLDGINARYDARMASLMALQEFIIDDQGFLDTIAQIDMERVEEVEEFKRAQQQRTMQDAREKAQSVLNAVASTVASIGSLVGQVYSQQIDNAREGSAEQKRLLKEQFIAQKVAAIASAAIGTALAVVQALNFAPPASFVMAGLAGALGAVQIGIIAAQQPPSFHTGGILAPDEVSFTGVAGEGVLTQRGVNAVGGPQGIAEINSGRAGTSSNGPVIVANIIDGRVVEAALTSSLEAASPATLRALHKASNRAGRRLAGAY